MLRFLALRDASQPSSASAFLFPDEMRAQYPCLVAALGGQFDQSGRAQSCMYTLMLFVEGGKLKFNLSSKYDAQVFWGVVDDPVDIVASLEACLAEGRGEWRKGKKQVTVAQQNGNS